MNEDKDVKCIRNVINHVNGKIHRIDVQIRNYNEKHLEDEKEIQFCCSIKYDDICFVKKLLNIEFNTYVEIEKIVHFDNEDKEICIEFNFCIFQNDKDGLCNFENDDGE